RSLNVLKRGGKIVVFGATTEDTVDFNLREFFYGQYQLFGSTMGSREELNELLLFMEKHEIKTIVGHTYPLHQIEEVIDFFRDNIKLVNIDNDIIYTKLSIYIIIININ